ncbi:MAG TPA: CoA pyrophosphatase [Chitinophagales bacterium]|nr:CoA pyrophosphatase [Chitinophagales bacterium]HRK29315.1 CoA pyrophosphatase [Chitinophagales bacterium]
MHLNHVTQLLQTKLQQPLPGDTVRMSMAPNLRIPANWKPHNIDQAMQAGVLILLYPHHDTVFTALMQRNVDGHAHSGQISFPGGRYEDSDANLTATALRETREEFGIDDTHVTVLGALSQLYIPASNFWVLPTVGYLTRRPTFNPDTREVAAVLEVPLPYLLQESIVKQKTITGSTGITIQAPYYDVDGHVVWGATAMIISEFLHLLR